MPTQWGGGANQKKNRQSHGPSRPSGQDEKQNSLRGQGLPVRCVKPDSNVCAPACVCVYVIVREGDNFFGLALCVLGSPTPLNGRGAGGPLLGDCLGCQISRGSVQHISNRPIQGY